MPPGHVTWFLWRLDLAHVRRLETLGTTGHVELEGLTLRESLETLALNRREVDENVLAILLGDEAKTLRLIEPLHCTTSHLRLLTSGRRPHYRQNTRRPRSVTVTCASNRGY